MDPPACGPTTASSSTTTPACGRTPTARVRKRRSPKISRVKYCQSLEPLLNHIETQIQACRDSKRPVTLSFVKEACVAKIKEMEDIGVAPMFRGKALTASTTWLRGVMVGLGYASRRRSKIRPTSVEVLLTIINELLVCL